MADLRTTSDTTGLEPYRRLAGLSGVDKAHANAALFPVFNRPAAKSFNVSITFDDFWQMPEQLVAAATVFVPDLTNAADNSETLASMIANGDPTKSVTVDPSIRLVGVQDYDNTRGRINYFSFWRSYGRHYYGVTLDPLLLDLDPPVLLSATYNASSPTLVTLNFNEPLAGTLAAASAFGVSGSTVNSVAAGGTSSQVVLTLASAVLYEDTKTAGYTKPLVNMLQDTSGNQTATFSGVALTHESQLPRVITFSSGVTETGSTSAGWTYSSTSSSDTGWDKFGGNTNLTFPNGKGASVVFPTNAAPGPMGISVGLKASNANADYTTWAYGLQAYSATNLTGGGVLWGAITAGSVGSTSAGNFIVAPSDIVKFERNGSTIKAYVAPVSDPTNFTLVHTWSGASTAQHWPVFNFRAQAPQVGPITGAGMT